MRTFDKRRWRWCGLGAAVMFAVAIAGLAISRHGIGPSYRPVPFSPEGSSELIRDTVIVPTLDSLIPEGKSAIWCVSFQLAWNYLKDDVAKGPVQLVGAQPLAD